MRWGVEGGGQGKGAVQRLLRNIDLSVSSLPVRCVHLVEDRVGFSVLHFSFLFLESCLSPHAPRTACRLGLCAEIPLTGVLLLVEAQGDLVLLSLLCYLEAWKRQERAGQQEVGAGASVMLSL